MGRKSGTESIAAVLLAFLQQRTWKQADLARHVGVERKTLKRILDDIHGAGLKLEQDHDPPHVYWSVPKTWFPGGVAFRAEQLTELVRTLQLAPQSSSRERLLGMIATTATGMRGTSTANAILTRSLSPSEETVLAQLQRAAEERVAVGMRYFTLSRGDLANREVSVHRLLVDVGRFIATCHRDGRLKWFRIDGVQAVYAVPNEAYRAEEESAVTRLIDESVDGYHSGTPPTRCDATGRRAYDPRVLLKIVIYGYYKGILSSRALPEACRRNVVFMALSADTRPHFTTIAAFVSELHREIASLFRDVLLFASQLGLIGKEHFAVDGCKLPSNASKQWSGTHRELDDKRKKLERVAERIVLKHQQADDSERQMPQKVTVARTVG